MRFVCLSDTHREHGGIQVPDGDVLIHAGDFTNTGSIPEVVAFDEWLERLPHKHKVVVSGNHDRVFAQNYYLARAALRHGTHLGDCGLELDGIPIWGASWSRPQNFEKIPPASILITHEPPAGVLDIVDGRMTGAVGLLTAVLRTKPRVHVFGHIHEGYGTIEGNNGTLFVNASTCNSQVQPVNRPIVFDFEPNRDPELVKSW